jgi:hypothetical protein
VTLAVTDGTRGASHERIAAGENPPASCTRGSHTWRMRDHQRSRRVGARCSAVVAAWLALFFSFGGVGLAAGSTITAVSGAFQTVIPTGFANETAAYSGSVIRIEMVVMAPAADGYSANINVGRERVKNVTVAALVQASLAVTRAATRAHAFSPVQSLTVGGDPARAYDYLTSFDAISVHQRQVFVIHDGWAYVVTYSALSGSDYQVRLPALGQMLSAWRWR